MPWMDLIRRRARSNVTTAGQNDEVPAGPKSPRFGFGWMRLARDRRGAIAVMYAILLLPLVSICALAVDFSFYISARSQLDLAADAAAVHAVRIATQLYISGSTSRADAETAGARAGQQWLVAQLGSISIASIPSSGIAVNVAYQPSPGGFRSTVSYSGTVATHIGSFITPSWGVGNTFNAQLTNSFAEIILMLDDSSSMAIGATTADMAKLNSLSPCDPSNAYYYVGNQWTNASLNTYSTYQCSGSGQTYPGPNPCPVPAVGLAISTFTPSSSSTGPSCQGLLPMSNGKYPLAGAPCAFACHWDGTKPAGQGNDLWAMARRNNIQMRFDLLKNAVNIVINDLQAKSSGNLSIGIFTFDTSLTKIYPASGEAGSDWTTALAAVGTPPVFPAVTETGIQPYVGQRLPVNNNSYFPNSMNTLATRYLTNSGDGTTAAKARKSLVLITDGFEDDSARQAMSYTVCQQFKNMGYTVYVIYTPYYPVMHGTYFSSNWAVLVQGTGPTSIQYNLQACATSPSNYISAQDGPTLNTAMLAFVAKAMNASAQLIQ